MNLIFALMIIMDGEQTPNEKYTTYYQNKDECRFVAQEIMRPGDYYLPGIAKAYCAPVFVNIEDVTVSGVVTQPKPQKEDEEP
jgi:hypothetical protein